MVLDALERLAPTGPELVPLIDAPELDVRLAALELLWKRGDVLPEGRLRELVWQVWDGWVAIDESGQVVEWPAFFVGDTDRCRVTLSNLPADVVAQALDAVDRPCTKCWPRIDHLCYLIIPTRVEKHCFMGADYPSALIALTEEMSGNGSRDAEASRAMLLRRLTDGPGLRDCRLVYEKSVICEGPSSDCIRLEPDGRWQWHKLGGDTHQEGSLDAAERGRLMGAVAVLLAITEDPGDEDTIVSQRVWLARDPALWPAAESKEPLFHAERVEELGRIVMSVVTASRDRARREGEEDRRQHPQQPAARAEPGQDEREELGEGR